MDAQRALSETGRQHLARAVQYWSESLDGLNEEIEQLEAQLERKTIERDALKGQLEDIRGDVERFRDGSP